MARLLVHPDQRDSLRWHVPPQRGPLQEPVITRAQAARLVEVELLRAVMSEPPSR